jgi:MFS family permease
MIAHTPRTKNLALVLLAMTQFVIVIDASIVNVALPSIGAHLHFSRDDLTWVVNAYTLTFGGFLLLGGRMADLLGRRSRSAARSGSRSSRPSPTAAPKACSTPATTARPWR